ncbi:MAG: hypothetical protein ACXW4Q_06095 [Anaerolineales bacterium]
MPSDTQVIYSMNKVRRIEQSAPDKQVLRDPQASLGFYYSATWDGIPGLNSAAFHG